MLTESTYVRVDTVYSKITSSPNLILGRGTTVLVYGNLKGHAESESLSLVWRKYAFKDLLPQDHRAEEASKDDRMEVHE